jgi:serine/threonine protein kinase
MSIEEPSGGSSMERLITLLLQASDWEPDPAVRQPAEVFGNPQGSMESRLASGSDRALEAGPSPDERELLRLIEELTEDRRLAREPLQVGSLFGRYTILGEIVRGNSTIVYWAGDQEQVGPMALKTPHPELADDDQCRRRFKLEGMIGSMFDHPNIVPVYEFGEIDQVPYIVMEAVDGITMADLLQNDGPISPVEAARLVIEIAGAIGQVHDQGVLILDLKPQNILLQRRKPDDSGGQEWRPLLIDFGLAILAVEEEEDPDGRAMAGTPSYMAPEQILIGPAGCGPFTDLYAIGVILYELLIGRPPHLGENRFETIRAVIVEDPVALRDLHPAIPAELEAICLKCLSKATEGRYVKAQELISDLEQFLEGVSSSLRNLTR